MKMKVQEEIAWLKRGPKAQRNKNKSRIKDAHILIDEYAKTRARTGADTAVEIEFAATERKTKKLLAVHSLVKSLGDSPPKLLINKLNLVLSPGMKLGVLGPNGSGKSTFLKLLTGDLEPDAGTIKRAPDLRVIYFEQQRQSLDKKQLLRHALVPGGAGVDSVVYNGQLTHITSWARRFLFRKEQLERPVGDLSGGEQARIYIARMMLQQADVLILDEPTNDLDIPSLEVLEESLEEFPGALVLVTHDRFMLDRLSTEILGLDGSGTTGIFTDYDQYENWVETRRKAEAKAAREEEVKSRPAAAAPKKPGKKLTYKEQLELEKMESTILAAEEDIQKWHKQMEDPAVMADHVKLTEVCDHLHHAQEKVAKLYERWQEIEAKLAS
jgi:ATP-binding cassette subfamily F protein uup